jgi:hypothetical protein
MTMLFEEAGSKLDRREYLPPQELGSRKIQLPFHNTFRTPWEYRRSFLAGEIDFLSFIGPVCPICGRLRCYRQITAYWRNAIELEPSFRKERIPITRFLCRKRKSTFSLLPIQLIPYVQYTVHAVVATLLFGLGCWHKGQRGFYGASVQADPDSLVTPWLVACWLVLIVRGLKAAHALVGRIFDLDKVHSTVGGNAPWPELDSYLLALGYDSQTPWRLRLHQLLNRYSLSTGQFLFGIPSQHRPR